MKELIEIGDRLFDRLQSKFHLIWGDHLELRFADSLGSDVQMTVWIYAGLIDEIRRHEIECDLRTLYQSTDVRILPQHLIKKELFAIAFELESYLDKIEEKIDSANTNDTSILQNHRNKVFALKYSIKNIDDKSWYTMKHEIIENYNLDCKKIKSEIDSDLTHYN